MLLNKGCGCILGGMQCVCIGRTPQELETTQHIQAFKCDCSSTLKKEAQDTFIQICFLLKRLFKMKSPSEQFITT